MAREVVLVGGGHAHVQVMTAFAAARAADCPWPDARLTLVSPDPLTPYSGMLPGHVAGLYRHDEMHIDLGRLAAATGTRFVEAAATGLDRTARSLAIAGGGSVPYDLVSFDVGITPDLSGIDGADRHALAVKPIGRFLDKLSGLRTAAARTGEPFRLVIVGGGPAGVELAFALRQRLRADRGAAGADPDGVSMTLATSGPLLASLNAGVRRRARAALAARRIHVREGVRIAAVTADAAVTETGEGLAADSVVISTKARAPDFLAGFGLPTAPDGSLLTRFTLQSLTDPAVFAVGDCATVANNPNQKAGVFAVRQGPVLADNLVRRLTGAPLRPFRAQPHWLVLMTTGDGHAIGARGPRLAVSGRWVWRWKDHIDRAFMAKFQA